MKRIRSLPIMVANQIAAGEVIERPASVVKELFENALDSGATKIDVDIGFGGLNKIKVSDNGSGIYEEDMLLSVAPHATSKIYILDDLDSLQSMGFRGEALASIASVARVSILSRTVDAPHATLLECIDGHVRLSPFAREQGTSVEVLDLFYNAPVRKKFLKSERTEFLAIESLVRRLAMSAPTVQVTLIHNGKQQFHLPAAHDNRHLLKRACHMLGKRFGDAVLPINAEYDGMHLSGWVGSPAYQRSQHDGYWVYLNQRFIKDKLLNHAIKQAYNTWLAPGRYPVCLLYLILKPHTVDVNVHPTKHEVRFQDARLVHDFLVSEIQQALTLFEENGAFSAQVVWTPVQHQDSAEVSLSAGWPPAQHVKPAFLSNCSLLTMRKEEPLVTKTFGSVENSFFEDLRPAACPRDPEILLNDQRYYTETERSGSRGQAAGSRALNCQHALVLNSYCLSAKTISASNLGGRSIIIDHQFGILSHESWVYVVDWILLRYHWHFEYLMSQDFPWASRSLFVPVSVCSNQVDQVMFSAMSTFLKQLGLTVSWIDGALMVETIPIQFPQLDLAAFFEDAFALPELKIDSFMQIFAKQAAYHAEWMNEDEQRDFEVYWQNNWDNLCGRPGVARVLSDNVCRELLNE